MILYAELPRKEHGAEPYNSPAHPSSPSFPRGRLLGSRPGSHHLLQPRGAAPLLCKRAADPDQEPAGWVRGAAPSEEVAVVFMR